MHKLALVVVAYFELVVVCLMLHSNSIMEDGDFDFVLADELTAIAGPKLLLWSLLLMWFGLIMENRWVMRWCRTLCSLLILRVTLSIEQWTILELMVLRTTPVARPSHHTTSGAVMVLSAMDTNQLPLSVLILPLPFVLIEFLLLILLLGLILSLHLENLID